MDWGCSARSAADRVHRFHTFERGLEALGERCSWRSSLRMAVSPLKTCLMLLAVASCDTRAPLRPQRAEWRPCPRSQYRAQTIPGSSIAGGAQSDPALQDSPRDVRRVSATSCRILCEPRPRTGWQASVAGLQPVRGEHACSNTKGCGPTCWPCNLMHSTYACSMRSSMARTKSGRMMPVGMAAHRDTTPSMDLCTSSAQPWCQFGCTHTSMRLQAWDGCRVPTRHRD